MHFIFCHRILTQLPGVGYGPQPSLGPDFPLENPTRVPELPPGYMYTDGKCHTIRYGILHVLHDSMVSCNCRGRG